MTLIGYRHYLINMANLSLLLARWDWRVVSVAQKWSNLLTICRLIVSSCFKVIIGEMIGLKLQFWTSTVQKSCLSFLPQKLIY